MKGQDPKESILKKKHSSQKTRKEPIRVSSHSMKIQLRRESCLRYKKPKQLIRSEVHIREKKKRSLRQFFSEESVQGKWDFRKYTSKLCQFKSSTLKKRSSNWKHRKKHDHSSSRRGLLRKQEPESHFFLNDSLRKDSWKYRKKKTSLNRSTVQKGVSWKHRKKKCRKK